MTVITLRYDELAPILLSEAQQQRQRLAATTAELSDARALIVDQGKRMAAIEQQLAEVQRLKDELQAALAKLRGADDRLAMR